MFPSEGDAGKREPNHESGEGLRRFLLDGEFNNIVSSLGVRFTGDVTTDDSSGRLLGGTEDMFGHASIIGQRLPNALCFTKIYLNGINPYPITYEFTRDNKGSWVGKYSYIEAFGRPEEISGEASMTETEQPGSSVISREDFEFVYEATLQDIAKIRARMDRTIGRTPNIDEDEELPF